VLDVLLLLVPQWAAIKAKKKVLRELKLGSSTEKSSPLAEQLKSNCEEAMGPTVSMPIYSLTRTPTFVCAVDSRKTF
jgi:hypothetical protein